MVVRPDRVLFWMSVDGDSLFPQRQAEVFVIRERLVDPLGLWALRQLSEQPKGTYEVF